MALNGLGLGVEKSSTKDLIIGVLSEQWPLSTKVIFNRIQKQSESSVSYQAVHKLIQQLLSFGVIEKADNKYCLNQDWISNSKSFYSKLESAYSGRKKPSTEEIARSCPTTVKFDTFIELGRFAMNAFYNLYLEFKKPSLLLYYNMWPPLTLKKEDFARFEHVIKKAKLHVFCKNSFPLDRISGNVFEAFGAKVTYGANVLFNPDMIIHGDYIGYFYFDPKIKKEWETTIAQCKKIEEFDITSYYSTFFYKKGNSFATIHKNAELADQFRRQYLPNYKEAKK